MENSRENSVDDRRYTRSSARESFRHLNSSNRRRVYKHTDKVANSEFIKSRYSDSEDVYNVDKVSKDFRRFLISAILVSCVVIVKILDFGLANTVEAKLTTFLRSSSAIDSKISNSIVSLSEKMGINIDELNSLDDSIDSQVENEEKSANTGSDSVVDENPKDGNVNTVPEESGDTVDEQITDFYIDDEVLEGVLEDEKKW